MGHPRRSKAYLDGYGEYKDKDRNWSAVPEEQLPVCRLVLRLQFNAKKSYQQTKDNLEHKENQRLKIANDVLFLEQEFPNIYQQEFTPDGEIASGVTAVRLASNNFFGKAANLEFAGLGLSLGFFSLSFITSVWSISATVKFAQRKDVADSFDSDLELKRDLWFEKLKRDAVEDEENDG